MNDNNNKSYNEYNNENENYDALVLAAKHFITGKNKSMCYISGNCKWWGEFWNVSSISFFTLNGYYFEMMLERGKTVNVFWP